MKNLKKALSMVLASAMLFGMMVVGTGAAHADVTAEHNEEAIAVVSAAGIMGANEEFNPDAKITRNEMAVVMVNMLGLDTDDFAGASQFTDVPAWAADYVDACYANGIVSGVSATEFNGGANVTTAEAALMVMKALGYFQYASDFGADWMLATIKQASKIDLLAGVDAKAKAAMTRNEVAQLVLNALEATMVDADEDGIGLDAEGNLVSKYDYVKVQDTAATDAYENALGDAAYIQLGEDLFKGDLAKVTVSGGDDFARPAHKWTFKANGKTEDVITVADKADYVVVATKAYTDALALYKDKVDEDFAGSITGGYEKVNGRNWAPDDATAGKYLQSGDVVEFYMNADDTNIEYTITTRYSIAKVTDISTSISKADKEDGVTAKIELNDNNTYIKDTKFAGFDAKTYTEDTYILYVAKTSTEIIDSKIADIVTGKVTAVKDGKLSINGTYYSDVSGDSLDVDSEGTFYLNAAGAIMESVAKSTKSDNYAYIYNIDAKTGVNAEGISATTYTAYMVLADGTKASYVIDADTYEAVVAPVVEEESVAVDTFKSTQPAEVKDQAVAGFTGIVAYAINDDGELTFKTAEDTIVAMATGIALDKTDANVTTGVYANSKTEFVFTYADGNKQKVELATGYKNVDIETTQTVGYVKNTDGYVLYAFVTTANGIAVSDDTIYAVILDDKPVKTIVDNKTYYTYTVAINGEEDELVVKNSTDLVAALSGGVTEGTIVSYLLEDGYVTSNSSLTKNCAGVDAAATVGAITDEFVVLNAQYDLGTETVYTIIINKDADGAFESIEVVAGGTMEKDDKVFFTTDNGDLDLIFIYEIVE